MKIRTHTELDAYRIAFEAAIRIFEITEDFPKAEKYSLTDQIRRSSRSVCANIAEAFRKRRYPKSFISKISDSEAEAAETQTWLEFALRFNYIDQKEFGNLTSNYDTVIGKLVVMSRQPEKWSV